MKWVCGVGLLIVTSFWQFTAVAQPAFTETPTPNPRVPRLAVAVGVVAGYSLGYRCPPTTDDVVACTDGSLPVGFRGSVRWRLGKVWAIGMAGGLDWIKGGPGTNSVTWRTLQLGGRYYFGERDRVPFWLEASAGVAQARDSLPAYMNAASVSMPSSHIATWGPAGSVAFGRDFELLRHLGVAPEFRLQSYAFSRSGPFLDHYNPQVMAMVGISVIGFGR